LKQNTFTSRELARKIRCNLFAKRDTLDEAMEYAMMIMKNDPAGMTALMVVLNTLADNIETAGVLAELGVE
jgi:hypothetical protein